MMKKLIYKDFLPAGRNQEGFTLMEVLVSMVILSVGIFGLMKTAGSVIYHQNNSKMTTEATLNTANKIEEIKRLSTNEPTGGAFGFNYLVTDYLTDEGFSEIDNQTYSESRTVGDFTTTQTLQIYPSGTSETFDDPTAIHMLEVVVKTVEFHIVLQ
ncbi:MAG TPA: prepilin-type N-terminal cleavage/methylation domain-containing protein [Nitrospinaceae bacterium]|nr:prepilin-type N-terminal cleavage/methylation domain-containing protein [Nitrospinaceae bacterium]